MPPTQVEANKAIVRNVIEKCCTLGNLDAFSEYIAPDCRYPGGAPFGPDAWKRITTGWRAAFPDFAFHVLELVAEDDLVVALLTFTGTHQNAFEARRAGIGPIEPTGKQVEVQEVFSFRLAAGKVVEASSVWDALGFLQQLGAVPALT